MRNLFDQYSQPENRLTHALLCSLDEDRRLLRRFISWAVGVDVRGRRLKVLCQTLPGEPLELSEDESDRRGLPDGCITDDEGWALLLESKFGSKLAADQLKRHARTARRKGLSKAVLLAITLGPPTSPIPRDVRCLTWSTVYAWLRKQARDSDWAQRCLAYLEVAETKGIESKYMKEGTLTVFGGIPFGDKDPYTYLNGKRVLGLLRRELVSDRRLVRLGASPADRGRPAITGKEGSAVWDFIPMRRGRHAAKFTKFPHLTFGIQRDQADAMLTLPNGASAALRSRLLRGDLEEFRGAVLDVAARMRKVLRRAPGAVPMIVVVQRHFRSQNTPGITDSILRFDLRTALSRRSKARGPVKAQPEWLEAAYNALRNRRSNMQFQIGVVFPFRYCKITRSPAIAEVMVQSLLACEPFAEVVRE